MTITPPTHPHDTPSFLYDQYTWARTRTHLTYGAEPALLCPLQHSPARAALARLCRHGAHYEQPHARVMSLASCIRAAATRPPI